MAVLQMQRVSICALKKDRKAILERLQSLGLMEVSQPVEDDDIFQRMDTTSPRLSFEKKAHTADQALDVLEQYVPRKQSMFASLEGKKLVEKEQFRKAAEDREEIMDMAADILLCSRQIAEKKAAILKDENQIESLSPWLGLGVPMDFEGTEHTAMLPGIMAAGTTLEDVYAVLAEQLPQTEELDVEIVSSGPDGVYMAVFCMREDAGAVEDALRQGGFARPSQTVPEDPAVRTEELKADIGKLNREIEEKEEEIKARAPRREELEYISDYYRIRAEKYQVLGTLPQSGRTFLISGYVPAKAVPALQKAIEEKYDCVMDVEEPGEDEEPPTILHNNAISAEGISLCGSRGWMFEQGQEHDKKLIAREAGRIRASLQDAARFGEQEKILFLHYPPIFMQDSIPEFFAVMQEYGVRRCYYGHIHSNGCRFAFQGEWQGVQLTMVSADYLAFMPKKIG